MKTYKSYIKINLFLLIRKLNKKINLHKIFSIFYLEKNFYDEVQIDINSEKKNEVLYLNQNNFLNLKDCIFLKTISFLKENNFLNENVFFKIKVFKNIPFFSGVGSASSNAACLIKFLDENNLIYHKKKLYKKIHLLGSDIFFFIKNYDCAFVYKYGNKLIKIKKPKINLEIKFNDFKCETKKVFEQHIKNNYLHYNVLKQFFYFKINKYNKLENELLKSCVKLYPEMHEILKNNNSKLSGSGSTTFIIKKG